MSGAALFVYGTLQFPDVLVALLGRALHGRAAWLPDHARLSVRGAVYPGAVPRAGATTPGLLYEGVDAATLARLDAFEGELYERRRVVVQAERPSPRGSVHAGSRPAHGAPSQGGARGPAAHGSVHGSAHAAARAATRARGPATGDLAERVAAFAWIVARSSRGLLVEAPWDEARFARLHLRAYVDRCRARRAPRTR